MTRNKAHIERRRSADAQLVSLAARLLAQGDAVDFRAAKLRAAELLGLRGTSQLPDNRTLLLALVDYQRLFDRAGVAVRNRRLREAALGAMHFFATFEPRLVGPALYGTALAHTPVCLHLFSDEAEALTRFLLDARRPYALAEAEYRVARRATERYPVYAISDGDVDFQLVLMPLARLHHPPLSALDGLPCRRLDTAALAARLARDADGVWLDLLDPAYAALFPTQ
jgi:hypothetical protein